MQQTDFLASIGNTPLIYLRALSELTGAEIYGKAEFMNPGGSVKDRAALGMIEDAEKKGLLKKGGTIVEATTGNTGIALALVANIKGYKTKILLPSNQSQEKIDTLRGLGAEVLLIPPAPYPDPKNYRVMASTVAEECGGYYINQFENMANFQKHYDTTGPEIFKQTDGKLDGFVCAVGSGGTLGGVSKYLKEKNPKIQVACIDPEGSAMKNYFNKNEAIPSPGSTVSEGISQSFVTANVKPSVVDIADTVSDDLIFNMVHFAVLKEGLFLGSSAGANLCGAYIMAKRLGKGAKIVTILCDSGQKYISRLFNPAYLAELKFKTTGYHDDLFPKLDAVANHRH